VIALWERMSNEQILVAVATLLAAGGLWLLLPRGVKHARPVGALLALVALGIVGYLSPRWAIGVWADGQMLTDEASRITADVVFMILASVTVVSAAAAVSMRNPVYCAIWFALTLMGSAALFFFQGAQFLAVATVVVYAGAILVTFLFVLMLAQPRGHAYYDRLSWEPMLSACTGAVMIGILTMLVTTVFQTPAAGSGVALPAASVKRAAGILSDQHVAHLGGILFSEYLIAVEIAGTLLLVAIVGAVAITAHTKAARVDDDATEPLDATTPLEAGARRHA